MRLIWLCFVIGAAGACSQPGGRASAPPVYAATTILPNGATRAAPLAPGMLATIFGRHLGPATPCTGVPDPVRRDTPNPARPNQTLIETQMFPTRLCDTEVEVSGVRAGLLYVSAGQINFRVPQSVPVQGETGIRVIHQGSAGPVVRAPLGIEQTTRASAGEITDVMWARLNGIRWNSGFRPAPDCQPVPPDSSLRGGLYGYAYYCRETMNDVIAESFYYPANPAKPVVVLRRADFRLAIEYPAMSDQVEHLLSERLSRAYGPGARPGNVFEIGAIRPHPGLCWRAGAVTLFLNRNRMFVAPGGVHQGVSLIAVHQEVLDERELAQTVQKAFASDTSLSHPVVARDLRKELGLDYPISDERASERTTRDALLQLLKSANSGDRNRRAAALVAADDLAVRLGRLLVVRSVVSGSERLAESPEAPQVRRELARYGIRYSNIGHYSGDLEYDRALLSRAAREYLDTPWGQRASILLQRIGGAIMGFDCDGPNCVQAVIRRGEKLLREYPDTPFRAEQIYNLGLANETWWSLSQAQPGDPTAEGVRIDPASGETARKRAIAWYEELWRLAPDSSEAQAGRLALPRLKLRLDTGERTFFFFEC